MSITGFSAHISYEMLVTVEESEYMGNTAYDLFKKKKKSLILWHIAQIITLRVSLFHFSVVFPYISYTNTLSCIGINVDHKLTLVFLIFQLNDLLTIL